MLPSLLDHRSQQNQQQSFLLSSSSIQQASNPSTAATNTSHQSLSSSSSSSSFQTSTLSQGQQKATSPQAFQNRDRQNHFNFNYSIYTENYSVSPYMKLFISGYFIFDITFMLYIDRSSNELCIYFLLLLGGTALDLFILNDFYVFDRHNFKTVYPSQMNGGFSLGQFFDTCFLTIFVTYRLFRIYSVSKKWFPQFKTTCQTFRKQNDPDECLSLTSKESSQEETDINSPDVFTNNQAVAATASQFNNISKAYRSEINTLQLNITETKQRDDSIPSTVLVNTQNGQSKETQSSKNQINLVSKNPLSKQQVQQDISNQLAQQDQLQTLQQEKIRLAKSEINSGQQLLSGQQIQDININKKSKGKEQMIDEQQQPTQQELQKDFLKKYTSPQRRELQQPESVKNQIIDIEKRNTDQLNQETETQKNSNLNKKQQKKKQFPKTQSESQQSNNLLELKQNDQTQQKQFPVIQIKPANNDQQPFKRILNEESSSPSQKRIPIPRNYSYKNQGNTSNYNKNSSDHQYQSSPASKQNNRNQIHPTSQTLKLYKTHSNNEEKIIEKKTKGMEKPNKQIFYIQKQNISQQQQQLQQQQLKLQQLQQNQQQQQQNIKNKEQSIKESNLVKSQSNYDQLRNSVLQKEKIIEKVQQQEQSQQYITNTTQSSESKVEQKFSDQQLLKLKDSQQESSIQIENQDHQQSKILACLKDDSASNKVLYKQFEVEDQDIQITNLGISPSSFNESNGENSSPYLSPKNKDTCAKNVERSNSENQPSQNSNLMNYSQDKSNIINLQTKSQRKFSYDQDDESSSEENTERENQQIYKEDTHFEKSLSPSSQVQINLQSTILNTSRKLAESKQNKSNKKGTNLKSQIIASKSPGLSPSNIKQNVSSSTKLENQNVNDQEIIQSTQPGETIELRSKTETLAYLQASQASFKLDPKNNTEKNIGEKSATTVKDSWESVNNIPLKEEEENDPYNIDYFSNPLLEALSLPFRSPNIYAASPTIKEKQNVVSSFNGLLFQQISNWNEQQLHSSQTPEIFQTTSNTLSPKHQSIYQALSDNQNEKAKKRKSTNVNSEDLVSDQDKQLKAPAWRIISGEDENSYEEYPNERRYNQDLIQQDTNQEQLSDSKSQNILAKNQFEQKSEIDKEIKQFANSQLDQFTEEKTQKGQIQSEGEQKEKTLQENVCDQSNQFEDYFSNNQLLADLNVSLQKFEEKLQSQQYQQREQQPQNEEPFIIEIKSQNGKIFEIKINEFSEFQKIFDEQCQNNEMSKDDIQAAKINVLNNIVNSSHSIQNGKFVQEASNLLNEITLEYALNILESEFPSEQQFVENFRSNNDNFSNQQEEQNIYSQQFDNSYYNQQFLSPIQSAKFQQHKYLDEYDQQINLPEFNLYLENFQQESMLSSMPNFIFPNYLDFSRSQSYFQGNMGNTSPNPFLMPMARQSSLKQQIAQNQRVNHIYPQSVVDIDSPKSEKRKDQLPFSQVNSLHNKGLQSEIQLQSPVSKSFIYQPIPKYNSQLNIQNVQSYNSSNSQQQLQFQHNGVINMINQQQIQNSIDKQNPLLISSSSKKSKPVNSANNGIFDQWKFNPSSLINTPIQQAQLMHHINSDSSLSLANSQMRGQRVWQPHTPYLLDAPAPNLLKKPPTPQISSANNLFSRDLLNSLAELGQTVK